MSTFLKVLEEIPITYKGLGESVVLSQEVKLPFTIIAGPTPLSETGLPQLAAKPGAKIGGKWVILQDWSQCTQVCGGGKQYLQRMCVPPQNGGTPCEGEPIMIKLCNPQPCPNVITTEKETAANPTIIKMLALSSRPLRNEVKNIL